MTTATELAADVLRFAGARAGAAAALTACAALTEGIGLALLAPLLAILTGQASGTLQHVAERAFIALHLIGHQARLTAVLALFLAAIGLRVLIVVARERVLYDLQLGYVDERRAALVRRLAAARWETVVALRHARLTHALSGEVLRLGMAVQMMVAVPVAAAMLVVQAGLVALLAPQLGLVAIGLLGVAGIALFPLTRRAFAYGEVSTGRNVDLAGIGAQLLGGLKLATAHGLSGTFVAAFEATLGSFADEQRKYDRRRVRGQAIVTVGAAAALATLLLLGQVWAIPTPALLASLAVLSRMVGPATALLRDIRLFTQGLPAHVELRALADDLAQADEPQTTALPFVGEGSVCLDRVTFRYPGGSGVERLDLTIAPGEVVGLTGPSGAGKTTVADLLCGLLAPQEGRITLGGVPLDADALPAWRARIAYVPQESYLFDTTIRENLCWGGPALPDAALWAALDRVEGATVVRGMDGGLDAKVAERGGRLSGGERQRVALARALLRAPRLLILDEATSAIDGATEQRILGRLLRDRGRMAILLASHSPQVLALCPRVVTLGARRPAHAS